VIRIFDAYVLRFRQFGPHENARRASSGFLQEVPELVRREKLKHAPVKGLDSGLEKAVGDGFECIVSGKVSVWEELGLQCKLKCTFVTCNRYPRKMGNYTLSRCGDGDELFRGQNCEAHLLYPPLVSRTHSWTPPPLPPPVRSDVRHLGIRLDMTGGAEGIPASPSACSRHRGASSTINKVGNKSQR
jgi:hypothetical protein